MSNIEIKLKKGINFQLKILLQESKQAAYNYWRKLGWDYSTSYILATSEFPTTYKTCKISRAWVMCHLGIRPWENELLSQEDFDESIYNSEIYENKILFDPELIKIKNWYPTWKYLSREDYLKASKEII